MIKVEQNHVTVGIDKDPLSEILIKIDKDACYKASICTDLQYLFVALFQRFGQPTTAEMIEEALKGARENEYEVFNRRERNAKDNT